MSRDQQWAVIAPVAHCAYTRATEDTVVGERSMGDARLDYDEIVYGFFDHFLKGENKSRARHAAQGHLLHHGAQQVAVLGHLAARPAPKPRTFYLASGGRANSLYGDGRLPAASPAADRPDAFVYDPANPVPSYGGNVCCTGNAVQAGAFDQRKMEARADVLVYTSDPFEEGMELSGPHRRRPSTYPPTPRTPTSR